jgi:hypothetical protein
MIENENELSLTSSPNTKLTPLEDNNSEIEMTSKISTSEETNSDKENNNYNYTRADKQSIEKTEDLIFGNPINQNNPLHLGNTITLLYFKGSPLIVIGPDCKIFYLNLVYRFILYFFIFYNKFFLFISLFKYL